MEQPGFETSVVLAKYVGLFFVEGAGKKIDWSTAGRGRGRMMHPAADSLAAKWW
jgi:hypothetical protein